MRDLPFHFVGKICLFLSKELIVLSHESVLKGKKLWLAFWVFLEIKTPKESPHIFN